MMIELKPCPFCGGKVSEASTNWNLANAECTECGETWGYCGSKFKDRYNKWNIRADNKQLAQDEYK